MSAAVKLGIVAGGGVLMLKVGGAERMWDVVDAFSEGEEVDYVVFVRSVTLTQLFAWSAREAEAASSQSIHTIFRRAGSRDGQIRLD